MREKFKNVLFFVVLLVSFISVIPTNFAFAATPQVASARITGANTVTIFFSEPVVTTLNDYSNFTGALSGKSLSYISGSGTAVVYLNFSGAAFPSNATGGLTIASSVVSTSDNSNLGGGPYSVVDGQLPLLSSFTMISDLANGTVARSGNKISISFTVNESVYAPTLKVNGNNVSVYGSGVGPYTASYTMSSSDTQDMVSAVALFTDTAGNQGYGSFSLGGGSGPKIVSITSDANTTGKLLAGDKINFVLTLANPMSGAYISGSYNGVPLTWTTGNGGSTYTATYTVQTGNTSTYVPLQISGVTVRDNAGNLSIPASGSDILKTINAQSFSISEILSIPYNITTNTPRYGFYSPREGTIKWGGDCSDVGQTAALGVNYVQFKSLSNGLHTNCTLSVVTEAGYTSNTLSIPAFNVSVMGNGLPVSQGSSSNSQSQLELLKAQLADLQKTATINVPVISSYKFSKALGLGSRGVDVIELQKRLKEEGFFVGIANGNYGEQTQAAVKKYQKKHGLAQLGNVGPGTRAVLNQE
ncbi:MAG: peptidoglycan-binding domain-containing protein [bacterium]